MEQAEQNTSEEETEATHSLLYATMAYNRGEITLDEWLALLVELLTVYHLDEAGGYYEIARVSDE